MEHDLLRRAPLARGVFELIDGARPDASLRIGVYGRWGEGKTTILHFVEQLASADRYCVVWFNPWSATSPDDLWDKFVSAVLVRANPNFEPMKRRLKWVKDVVQQYGSLVPRVGEAAPLVASMLRFSEITRAEAEEALRGLGGKRLLVLVDDVDRMRPELVPTLLMSIRERLFIPGCHFLVAMDPDVVSRALSSVHAGWSATRDFLEKVLDYEFWLPQFSSDDRASLVRSELAQVGGPIGANLVVDRVDLLPENPRKLKRFLRSLSRLSGLLHRLDPDEVSWPSLITLELMRTVAPAATEILLSTPALLSELETATLHTRGAKRKALERLAELFPGEEGTALIPPAPHDAPFPVERPDETDIVVAGASDRAAFLKIAERFMDGPFVTGLEDCAALAKGELRAVTLQEVRDLLRAGFDRSSLATWISSQAATAKTAGLEVERALVRALIAVRDQHISLAVDLALEEDLQRELDEARVALECLRVVVVERHGFRGVLSGQEFMVLLAHFRKWAHFQNHPLHRAARGTETSIMLVAADDAAAFAGALIEGIGLDDGQRDSRSTEEATLVGTVARKLKTAVLSAILARFRVEDGIQSMGTAERHFTFKVDSGLYDEGPRRAFEASAREAATSPVVQRNFLDYLQMLMAAKGARLDGVLTDDAEGLARDANLMELAWRAATSRRIQPRMRQRLRETREALGRALGGVEVLPAPDWLDKLD